MKKTALILLVLAVGAFSQTAFCQNWTGNINAFIGAKSMDEDDWEPVEDQVEIGVMFDFQQDSWPVAIAVDIMSSSADDGSWYRFADNNLYYLDMNVSTMEICGGVRKIWDNTSNMTPFLGGGISAIYVDVESTVDGTRLDDDDSTFGLWVDGGVYWKIGERCNIGFDLRLSGGEVTLYGEDIEAGGSHLGFLVGYHW